MIIIIIIIIIGSYSWITNIIKLDVIAVYEVS